MKPGRELDALVAEKVMGWEASVYKSPSTDIAAAWEVVEKLRPERWLGLSEFRDGWRAVFSSTQSRVPLHPTGEAATAPHAICLAALQAVGHEIESRHRHDYVACSCGAVAVDGGRAYLRRAFRATPEDDFEELSEYDQPPEDA